jgi:hypothetical protein
VNNTQLAECLRLAENYHKNRLIDVLRAKEYYQHAMQVNLKQEFKTKKWDKYE